MIDDWGDAFEVGTGIAIAGMFLDAQTARINEAIEENTDAIRNQENEQSSEGGSIRLRPEDLKTDGSPDWDTFIGQEKLKQQLQVHIKAAQARNEALPHVLLASGMPGVGKTAMAKTIAKVMDVDMAMLVPPIKTDNLLKVSQSLGDKCILFIDEIHKLADGGQRGAEILLHLLEEKVLYVQGRVIPLSDITVIGATTDAGKLPETVIDRFPIRPVYAPYTVEELALITARFEGLLGVELEFEVTYGIAKACRDTPRIARELVMAARDLQYALDRPCTLEELLAFKELDPDGMTMRHKQYLVTLFRHFKQDDEYIAGEDSLRAMLRETAGGLRRTERFLMERGFIDRTTRGRKLTPQGELAAHRYAKEAV